MTWRRTPVWIAWFTSAVKLVHFVRNIESLGAVVLIWELVSELALLFLFYSMKRDKTKSTEIVVLFTFLDVH